MRLINHISHKFIVENNHFGSKQRNSYNNLADDKTFFFIYYLSNGKLLRHLDGALQSIKINTFHSINFTGIYRKTMKHNVGNNLQLVWIYLITLFTKKGSVFPREITFTQT